jgi:hypothetical protein
LDKQLVTPLIVSLLIGFSIYRRARRSIGRQPVRIARLWIRVAILGAVGGLLLVAAMANVTLLESLAAGMVGGALLAAIGLRHTKFESTSEGQFYTPHTYIGLLVMALFVARIAYRVMSIYMAPRAFAPSGDPFAQYQRTPLTLAVFGLLIGYYVVFNLGILRLSRAEPPVSQPQA